jgi:hypothetical protein
MWYAPTKVECRKCKRLLNQQEYTWVEQTSKWHRTCIDCDNKKSRNKKGDEINFIGRPKGAKKKYVKNPWLDAIITLSNRKIKGKDITEKDIKQIIDEGYFFILKNY